MNEQLQAAFDKKFKDTWFFEDVPLNHATPATTGRTHHRSRHPQLRRHLRRMGAPVHIGSRVLARPRPMTPCWLSTC